MELIQPLDKEPSILNEILDRRGEGFHHVCPHMTGLSGATFDERCRELEQSGLRLAMPNEVVGLARAAFYDALESIGGFIEVFELGKSYGMVPVMADILHGTDPLRSAEWNCCLANSRKLEDNIMYKTIFLLKYRKDITVDEARLDGWGAMDNLSSPCPESSDMSRIAG